jgi:hypothetical protein
VQCYYSTFHTNTFYEPKKVNGARGENRETTKYVLSVLMIEFQKLVTEHRYAMSVLLRTSVSVSEHTPSQERAAHKLFAMFTRVFRPVRDFDRFSTCWCPGFVVGKLTKLEI